MSEMVTNQMAAHGPSVGASVPLTYSGPCKAFVGEWVQKLDQMPTPKPSAGATHALIARALSMH